MAAITHRPTAAPTMAATADTTTTKAARYVFAGVRIALGWVFLWAFLDKTFGLGHETTDKAAWINGGHPTQGFLGKAATGPFQDLYHSLAGNTLVDWLFMLGLLGIGVALTLGIGMRIATATGALLLVLMWTAVLPPANNPFMDDHLIYAATLIGLALTKAENTLGLGTRWGNTTLVTKAPWLK